MSKDSMQPGQNQKTIHHLHRLAELSEDVFLVSTLHGRIVQGNQAGARLHGLDQDQLAGISIRDLIHPDGLETFDQIPQMLLDGDGTARYQIAALGAGGRRIVFDCLTVLDLDNELVFTVERDITDETATKRDLEIAQQFFTMSSDLFAILDNSGTITHVNAAFEHFVDKSENEVASCFLADVLKLNDHRELFNNSLASLVAGQQEDRLMVQVEVAGEQRALSMRIQSSNSPNTIFVAAHDTTDEHLLSEKLRRQASSDGLTGLANRAAFNDYLAEALATETTTAIAFLDLDKFKLINDSLGHAVGDDLLRAVAKRLEGSVRSGDFLARLGGDEFCIVYSGLDVDQVESACRSLLLSMSEPFVIDHRVLHTPCSIGVAVGTSETHTTSELLSEADAAGYRAKHLGRNRIVIFDEVLRAKVSQRYELEDDLRLAISEDQFDVAVQGIYYAKNLRLAGVEALVRWEHPTRGMVYPDEFLGVAEEIGLMGELGDRVLSRSLSLLNPWLKSLPSSTLSINISPAQLIDPRLAGRLMSEVEFYNVNPSQIVLEITETTLLDSIDRTADMLRNLRSLGFRLAMDDFGKGSSGLGYLRDLPFDIVKIDRGFVESLDTDTVNATIVEAVVSLARRLNMEVVAEGVETFEQVQMLRDFECTRLQGYYLHRPEPLVSAELVRPHVAQRR